jgi:glycerol-3-phosphate dehydrogenase
MTEKFLTENQVRRIAKEEAVKVQKEVLREITDVKDTLARLERLLLGELGTDQEDTLKARANIAYSYAKKNIDAKIIERAEPALEWFEDWDRPEKGCKESKLESLAKLITFFLNVRWLLALIGITTVLNAIPVIRAVLEWVSCLIV